ncbi:MAG: 50S ribosomal protein L15 [Bacteroidia bacterium]|nr:50S ribosomal protein L15 [Bacteroidia bacterium]
MNLSNLKPAEGSTHKEKRIGRGQGSGRGGTSTRGHKGAKSRSGYSSKKAHEGGQTPLQRRLPKYGFKNFNRVEYNGVNLDVLQKLADSKGVTEVNLEVLASNGLVSKNDLVKILGRGELKSSLKVKAHKFTETAKKAIEAAGGSVETI